MTRRQILVYIEGLPEDSAFKSIILRPYKEAEQLGKEQREALHNELY